VDLGKDVNRTWIGGIIGFSISFGSQVVDHFVKQRVWVMMTMGQETLFERLVFYQIILATLLGALIGGLTPA
jgi:hypothetical protein